jgi:hypothetical protein
VKKKRVASEAIKTAFKTISFMLLLFPSAEAPGCNRKGSCLDLRQCAAPSVSLEVEGKPQREPTSCLQVFLIVPFAKTLQKLITFSNKKVSNIARNQNLIIFDKCAKILDMKSNRSRPAGISLRGDQIERIKQESLLFYKSENKRSLHVQMILDEYWTWKDSQVASEIQQRHGLTQENPSKVPQRKKRLG